MLARDRLSLKEMSWMLVKVFFGYGGKSIPVVDRFFLTARQIQRSWTRGWLHNFLDLQI